MTPPNSSQESRPLLVNGEGLRIRVTATTSGGGDKFDPQTAEQAQALLSPQINSVVASVAALPAELRAADRVYIEARLLPNYIAASQFPSVLLDEVDAVPVGSRADIATYRTKTREEQHGTRRIVLTMRDHGLAALASLVETGGKSGTEQAFAEIRKLDQVTMPSVDSVLRAPETGLSSTQVTWEAVLHPLTLQAGQPIPLDEDTLRRWFELVVSVGGRVHSDFVRSVGGLTFMPVELNAQVVGQVARFNPLRVLRPMPPIRPRPRFGTRSLPRLQAPATQEPVASDPVVAVFDGGVDPSAPLFSIPTADLTSEPPCPDDLAHGTGVVGAVLYGLAAPGSQATQPPLPVESFRVLPAPQIVGDFDGYWVLDQIKEAVELRGAKIVNLSLGPELAVEDDMEPNRWTSELDQLAWNNDVLFITAAGNDGDQDRATGLHRVQVPADMANGLTVGSCNAPAPDKPWTRAPYSSMGPGRQGNRVQPLGVQFGGVDSKPFRVIQADGSFSESIGTSFSAPVTTHALAELATRLPRTNPSILRVFATHFAERARRHVQLRDEVGYGRLPLSFIDDLDCDPSEVHVLYVDEVRRGELLGYQVPIPTGMHGRINLRITLAYASPVEPSQPTEYTQASLELTFRPHYNKFRFRPPKGGKETPVELLLSSDKAFELMVDGWIRGQEPVPRGLGNSAGIPEGQLRDGGKWETLRHTRFSVDSTELAQPRLEVKYIARRAGGLDGTPTKIPFALLITAVEEFGSGRLYDRCTAQFTALRPIQRVQGRLRVR